MSIGKRNGGPTSTIVLGRLKMAGILVQGDEDGLTQEITVSHPFIKARDIPFLDWPAMNTEDGQVYLRGWWCTDGVLHLAVMYLGAEALDTSQFTIGVALLRSTGFPGAVNVTGIPGLGPNSPLQLAAIAGNQAVGPIAPGADAEIQFAVPEFVGPGVLADQFTFPSFGGGVTNLALTGWTCNAGVFTARVINIGSAPKSLLADELSLKLARIYPGAIPPDTVISASGSPSSAGPEDYWFLPKNGPAAPVTIDESGGLVVIPGQLNLPDVPDGQLPFWASTIRGLPGGLYGILVSAFGSGADGFQFALQSLDEAGDQGSVTANSVLTHAARKNYAS